jgi:hypothetical protein
MVLQNNYFIEEILPNAILRKLSDEEMAEYRRPFAEPGEGRRPTLTWPRQIPIEGEPADVHAIATEYADWLGTSNVPKLFLKAEPGAILANDRLVNLVRGWPAATEKTVAGIPPTKLTTSNRCGFAFYLFAGDNASEQLLISAKCDFIQVIDAPRQIRAELFCVSTTRQS